MMEVREQRALVAAPAPAPAPAAPAVPAPSPAPSDPAVGQGEPRDLEPPRERGAAEAAGDGVGAYPPGEGRAAAEVDAADELLASELMFNGVFAGLDAPRLAALVSCLVPCEKSQTVVELAASLAGPLAELQATARRIAEVQVACGVFAKGGGSGFGAAGAGRGGNNNNGNNNNNGGGGGGTQEQAAASSSTTLASAEAELYCDSFKPTLMDAVATWASGGTFQQAVDRTEMFEGSLIRAIRRLDEVLGQLGGAAEAVGDSGLAVRFADASRAIRRGIVFAASLYI